MDFWARLKKDKNKTGEPISALAPMAGITDMPFRLICKEFGADVVYSEMASATALVYSPRKTLELLRSDKKEAPYVVQLFGSRPEHFFRAASLVSDQAAARKYVDGYLAPSGIDINFGCPVKKVQKQGAGAVLMNDLPLARSIIKETIEATDLPVSIKTRIGAGREDVLRFLENISDLPIKAVMIHGRTLAQGFAGGVDFEKIRKARDFFGGVILANGGIIDLESARFLFEKTGADGIGVARGCLGRPWIFEEVKSGKRLDLDVKEIKKIALKQARMVIKLKGEEGLKEFRKHLCWYVQGLSGAKKLRQAVVGIETKDDLEKMLSMLLIR